MKKIEILEKLNYLVFLFLIFLLIILNLKIYNVLSLRKDIKNLEKKKRERIFEKINFEKRFLEKEKVKQTIIEIAKNKRIVLENIKEEISQENDFKIMIINLNFSGNFSDIVDFLYELESSKKFDISYLKLGKNEIGEISAFLTIKTYLKK